ncbi:MAG TPA: recombinase RecT, partial [Polyangiales bacterium]|nr:recombinase RecT [Polyangiales bacterium]
MSRPSTDNSGRIVRHGQNGNHNTPPPQAAGEAGKDDAPTTIADLLPRYEQDFRRVLPKHLTPERFMRLALSALRTTPGLADCTAASFLSCLMQCAQMGLEPNTALDLAYLIPRENRKRSEAESKRLRRPVKCMECTLQVGYKGYLQLARNANVHIMAYAVRDGDEFDYEYGLQPTLRHKPSSAANRSSRAFTHAYAVAKSPDFTDVPVFVVLSREEIMARKSLSGGSAKGGSPWTSKVGEERMWQKTAVRALVAWVPKSSEHLSRATMIDDASEGTRSLASSVDAGVLDTLQSH